MGTQKKHGKGRLDKWYKLAKEKGYRARAAFKLIQLNKKYGFLERSKVLLDLCAAPGSWCQVAVEAMPVNSLIVGVDLAPIKPIPRVYTFQGDITTDSCRSTIRQHLKTWKADTVLHDGAPNVGTAWTQDSFNQAELALQAMKLATEFLIEGGTFVTKIFRSKDYNPLLWVLNQLFSKVEATKPPSSRNVSAEVFVVCRGYKAPKRIDPRFLDPKSVFAELVGATANNEAKVYNPEKKKRKREGYEEGDYTQFKEIPADQFISAPDPIAILGNYSKLSLEASSDNLALAALHRLPETTPEIRTCCADLKVLGRRDFKMLLRWRLRVREIFGFSTNRSSEETKAEEVVSVEPMDEELRIQEELQAMQEKASSLKKREKRKENERKQKEIRRMQLNMTAPMDIGLEESRRDSAGMFSLKAMDKNDATRRILRGKMVLASEHGRKKGNHTEAVDTESLGSEESDAEADGLERELDSMYEDYRERKLEADAKYRAKKARELHEKDDEWQGLSASEELDGIESSDLEEEDDQKSEDEGGVPSGSLLRTFDNPDTKINGLSKRAAIFFGQDLFNDFAGILPPVNQIANCTVIESHDHDAEQLTRATTCDSKSTKPALRSASDVKAVQIDEPFDSMQHEQHVKGNGEAQKSSKAREADIDIITAEAMTLAHQLVTGQKTSHDVVDESYNRYSFRDQNGLPEWFLDDESKHDKPIKPITKAAARAIQEKMRAIDARPIKKVREAKARKKLKAAQRLEKLRKKSDMLANDEGMTEKEKSESIARLLSKAARKKPAQPAKLVVAKGLNRGIQGRPRGVKGRYRMVDPRMKKELRAQKRIAQRRKR